MPARRYWGASRKEVDITLKMQKDKKVFIAGDEGMIGAAIARRLREKGFTSVVMKNPAGLDLSNQQEVFNLFKLEKPEYVFLASSKIGGIQANSKYPADFIYANLQSQNNVIHASWQSGVKKLLFLASSCIYPKSCPQPMKEEYLLTGPLEPTSEPYAIAKIAGIRMCQSYRQQHGANFIAAVPSDLYGPGDDFNPETGHVLPGLIARMHRAKMRSEENVVVWGTGTPRREAFHVDDLAEVCLFLMDNYDGSEMINAGSGQDIAIGELAGLVKEVVGYKGEIVLDRSKPDGAPRKLLDVTKIRKLGWAPGISMEQGIRQTYQWYLQHEAS